MFEKIGIRMSISIIAVWFILAIDIVRLIVDGYTFSMIVLYSLLLSLSIEIGYSLLRKYLRHTPYVAALLFIIWGAAYLYWGWGMYVGFITYVFGSLLFDLYREYKMYCLLQVALKGL